MEDFFIYHSQNIAPLLQRHTI